MIKKIDYDTAAFSCVGFADVKVSRADLKDGRISLESISYELNEVTVSGLADPVTIGEIDSEKNKLLNLTQQHMAAYFFENTYGQPVFITSFLFKADKIKYRTAVRVRMFAKHDYVQDIYVGKEKHSYDSFIPGKDLLAENIIVYLDPQKKGVIEIDLSGYNLMLPDEGAFFAVECLDYYDKAGDRTDFVDKPTSLEMHISETDNYCLRYNLKGMWVNINKWIRGDYKYAFRQEVNKKALWAPSYGLKVTPPRGE